MRFFTNIIEGKDIISHNYKMMQLYAPLLSVQAKKFVRESIENFDCTFNKTKILSLMTEDGFGELNWEDLKTHLNKILLSC